MRFFYVVLILILSSCANQAAQKNMQLEQNITEILSKTGQDLNIGIKIENLKTNQLLYQLHSKRNFIPASNLKLFTSYAALQFLGPNFKFKTEATSNQNDIYLKWNGDPTLTYTDLYQLITKVKLTTTEIIGDLIIDDTALDENYMGEDEHTIGDLKFCFAAPASTVTIDKNCYITYLKPASTNKPAILTPESKLVTIHNQTITSNKKCKLELIYLKDNQYKITGCVSPDAEPLKLQIAIQDPHLMLTTMLKQILKEQQITLAGKIKFASLAKEHNKLIATHYSAPLSAIIAEMNKNSDNVIAALLYKQLGASYAREIGSYDNAKLALHHILKINPEGSSLQDGSGGSYSNLVSPEIISNLLKNAYTDPAYFPVFFNSLAIGGVDGTLKNRFKGPLTSKIFAKTGAIKGVSSLAGYLKIGEADYISFVIMINGASGDLSKYKALEEKIVEAIYTAFQGH